MLKVKAAEFQRNIGKYQDIAMTQPVAVTRNGRDGTVLISTEEYKRLKRGERRVLRLEDFTDDDLEAIENARIAPEAAEFNHEMEE